MILGLAIASALAEPPASPQMAAPEGAYEGAFASAPVPHWTIQLPGGRMSSAAHTERAQPVVQGGVVYVGSAAGSALYALDRTNGSLLREYPAASSVESAPLISGDRVYFADTGGRTWCYTLDGEKVWSHDSAAPILVRPTLADGLLFITNVDDLAVALDATTGELAWRHQQRPDVTRRAELALYAAPPAVVVDDVVLVGFSEGSLVALSQKTGDVRWQVRVGEGRYPDIVAEPTVAGDLVFVAGYYEPLMAVHRSTRRPEWTLPLGSASGGVLLGSGEDLAFVTPGTDGKLRSIRASTGKEIWTWDSKDSGALTQPVITEAGLIVGSSTGTLTIVDPEDGSTRWTLDLGRIMEGVSAPPAVDGRQLLFVTNAGLLYSMLAPGTPTTWPRVPARTKRGATASRPQP